MIYHLVHRIEVGKTIERRMKEHLESIHTDWDIHSQSVRVALEVDYFCMLYFYLGVCVCFSPLLHEPYDWRHHFILGWLCYCYLLYICFAIGFEMGSVCLSVQRCYPDCLPVGKLVCFPRYWEHNSIEMTVGARGFFFFLSFCFIKPGATVLIHILAMTNASTLPKSLIEHYGFLYIGKIWLMHEIQMSLIQKFPHL